MLFGRRCGGSWSSGCPVDGGERRGEDWQRATPCFLPAAPAVLVPCAPAWRRLGGDPSAAPWCRQSRMTTAGFAAPLRVARCRLSCSSATSFCSPVRWRQRVSGERPNGRLWQKNAAAQSSWSYGFSSQRSHSASSKRSCMSLRMTKPNRVPRQTCTPRKVPNRKTVSVAPASDDSR